MFLSLANTEFSNYFINAFIPIYTDLYHFILQLLFVSYWGLQKGFSFNTPSWSISIEILMYIVFFLSAKNLNKHKVTLPISIILFFLISYKFTNFFNFDEYALLFFSGVLIYQITKFKRSNLLISANFLILIFSFIGNFKILLFCPSFLILLIYLDKLIKNNKISGLFNFFGGLSYSIYMTHFPLMVLFLLFEHLAIINEKFYFSNYFFCFFNFLIIFISIISFKFYEYPLNKKIRKIFL